jgi:hypothetical protein
MLSQLLNQMDDYLANKPLKRRWWSRAWIVHMTIQPPLSKDDPLWKRSRDELRLLRLFDMSPEELRLKIERYWKKPRWRRWFASFGMNKKIDVWNYYQRCLAYRAVRPDKLEPERSIVLASESSALLNELGLALHQSHVKFETYLEKRCRNPKWIETHFLKEIKAHKEQLKKTFLIQLNKSLKQIAIKGERFALKQQAEQEYQQVEALMLRYFELQLNNFFSHLSQANLVSGIKTDVAQAVNSASSKRDLAVYHDVPSVSFVSQPTFPIAVNHQSIIGSLNSAKEWIQTQRQDLNLLIEVGSLQKVEALLQASLNEIKAFTEPYLVGCETSILTIQGKDENYEAFLEYLNNLQCRLKPLLQGGMLLFHPDHAMSLTDSQAMWDLLTRYSQSYLEQSRCYLNRFKSCHQRIEAFYQHSQKELQRQQSLRDLSELAQSIQKLGQSVKDLQESFKEFGKKLKESEEQRVKDKEAMEEQRVKDKEAMELQLKESEEKRVKDKEAMEEQRVKDKEAMEAQMKELRELINLHKPQQAASSSVESDADMPKSSNNAHFFRP